MKIPKQDSLLIFFEFAAITFKFVFKSVPGSANICERSLQAEKN